MNVYFILEQNRLQLITRNQYYQ